MKRLVSNCGTVAVVAAALWAAGCEDVHDAVDDSRSAATVAPATGAAVPGRADWSDVEHAGDVVPQSIAAYER